MVPNNRRVDMPQCLRAACAGGLFLLLASPLSAQDAAGDASAGKLVFNNSCRTCHTLEQGDDRLGPNLHAILGRKVAAAQGYSYSSAMKGAGLTWDAATLDRFIADPQAVIPGNNMKPYTGMSSTKDRADLVAYLSAPEKN